MTESERFDKLLSIGEEVVNAESLRSLLQSGHPMIAYDGFEPSNRPTIAQGLMRAINTNKITECGGTFIFFVADLFAMMNGKLGGDMTKIRAAGELMIETWKACGMKMDNVKFIWASEEIERRGSEYWPMVLDLATKFTINRMKGCTPALGREESDELPLSTLLYAAMQAVDIPFLKVNVASLGLDQRKVLMITNDLFDKKKLKHKPTFLMHHMMLGLDGTKMSKSDPDNAIFMDDPPSEVNRKIKKAVCPERITQGNPIIDIVQAIVFPICGTLKVERDEKFGGNITFANVKECLDAFTAGQLHPGDLKDAVALALNKLLAPVQQHFNDDPAAKTLLNKVKSFKIPPKSVVKPKEPVVAQVMEAPGRSINWWMVTPGLTAAFLVGRWSRW